MAELDRATFIVLLDRLGSSNDATALKAARELHESVTEAGITWDDLLRPESGESEPFPNGADTALEPEEADDAPAEEDEPADTEDEPVAATDGKVSAADRTEVGRLIERLLAKKSLTKTTRQDLAAFKRSVADGSIDAMDCNYVRALAKRLGV